MTITKTKKIAANNTVTWSVSADGYEPQTGTIENINDDKILNINLLGKYGTIDVPVKKVSSSGHTTIILLKDGSVWGCGRNNKYQINSKGGQFSTFQKICDDGIDILSIGYGTFVIKKDNTLWAIGNSDYSFPLFGTSSLYSFTKIFDNIKKVSCSGNNTLLLTTEGEVYGCGCNTYGDLGVGDTTRHDSFVKVNITDVKDIYTFEHTSWILKNDNSLWSCGFNPRGNQGTGDTTQRTVFGKRLENVADVKAIGSFTLALKLDGSLWGCGENSYGCLGDFSTTEYTTTFTKISDNVKKIFVGGYRSGFITNDASSDLYLTGWGTSGEQCNGQYNHVYGFHKVASNVEDAILSESTWILNKDGEIWMSGSDNYGSSGKNKHSTLIKKFSNAKTIKGGSFCCWAINEEGGLYGCGNNEYYAQATTSPSIVTEFTKRNMTKTGYNSAIFSITPTPSDAEVTIDNNQVSTAEIRKGTSANWTVSKSGYKTKSGTTDLLYNDLDLNVELEVE